VFTCATDYCPLSCTQARQRNGMLFSDAQSLDHCTIPCIADATKIVEQPPPPTDQKKQATPGMMIFLVELEMFRQIRDPVGQHRDLDFRRAGIRLMLPILLD
jgi:hypothetical protein